MRRVAVFIITLGLMSTTFAQEPIDLHLSHRLYFRTLFSGSTNSLFYIQETNTPIEVFSSENPISDFSWSPDGSYIFMVVNDSGTWIAKIYTDDFELVRQHMLNLYERLPYGRFPIVWSPDSQSLLAVQRDDADKPVITSLPIFGELDLTNHHIPLQEAEQILQVYWSPDSQSIAYQIAPPGDDVTIFTGEGQPKAYPLRIFDMSTGAVTAVADNTYAECVSWSYDNTALAYVTDRHRDEEHPFLLRSDDLAIYQVADNTNTLFDLERGELNALDCPLAWSRDGESIALSDVLYDEARFDEASSTYLRTGIAEIFIETGEIVHISYTDDLAFTPRTMVWSPDDAWIAIKASFSAFGDIRLINVHHKQEYIIRMEQAISNPVWK